jgi:hypothetical protein
VEISAILSPPSNPSILRDMRCDLHVTAVRNEVGRVKAFVAAHRHSLGAGNLFQHHQRRIALAVPLASHTIAFTISPLRFFTNRLPL